MMQSRVIAQLAQEFVRDAHRQRPPARVLMTDLPRLDPEPILEELAPLLGQDVNAHVAYIPPHEQDISLLREKAKDAGLPADRFAWTVEQAEHWRNTLGVSQALVVVAPWEHPKLSSFSEFSRLSAARLKELLCLRAIRELEDLRANDVLKLWWRLLAKDAAVALGSLLDYYLAVKDLPLAEYVDRVGKELYRLGLLPDAHLLDDPSSGEIRERVEDNRRVIAIIKELSEGERRAIMETLRSAERGAERSRLEATFRLIQTLYDGGVGSLSQMEYEDVARLLWGRQERPRSASRPTRSRHVTRVPLERRVLEWVLSGEEGISNHIAKLFDKVTEDLSIIDVSNARQQEFRYDDPEEPTGIQIVLKLVPKLLGMAESCFADDCLTTLVSITGADVADIEKVLLEVNPSSVLTSWKTGDCTKYLEHFGPIDAVVRVHVAFNKFLECREKVRSLMRVCAAAPLLACVHSDTQALIREYISAFEALLSVLDETYPALHGEFEEDAYEFVARIMLMDTIVFCGEDGKYAALIGPLHPLHLWHSAELARLAREQAGILSQEDKELIMETGASLPNFLGVICIGRPIRSSGTSALVPVGRVGALAFYAEQVQQLAAPYGKETITRWLRAFVRLHPHARTGLRVAAVNAPVPGELLSVLCDLAEEQYISAAHLTVVRSGKSEPPGLGVSSDEEWRVAEFFRGSGRDSAFTLSMVECREQDWARFVSRELLAHVLLVFDETSGEMRTGSVAKYPVQPLAVPRRFRVRIGSNQLDLVPAPGGVFGTYYRLVRLLDPSSGPPVLITHQNEMLRATLDGLARSFPWLIVADRYIDRDLKVGALRVASARESERELVAFAQNGRRFRQILRGVARGYNTAVTDEQLDELLDELSDLLDEGLLGIIPRNGDSNLVAVRAVLGTLIAARWYRQAHPGALLVSLDSTEARRWLRLRQDNRRADLLGVNVTRASGMESVVIDILEVKTGDALDAGAPGDEAVDQLLATRRVLEEVFCHDPQERERESMVTPARREVLREHFYRECSKARHEERRSEWANVLNGLFDGRIRFTINLNAVRVRIGSTVDSTPREYSVAVHGGEPIQVRAVTLSERTTGVAALIPPAAVAQLLAVPSSDEGSDHRPLDQSPGIAAGVAPSSGDGSSQAQEVCNSKGTSHEVAVQVEAEPRAWLGYVIRGRQREEAWFRPAAKDRPLHNPHLILTGATGTGKTQAVKAILYEFRRMGLPALILDFKDDYSDPDYAYREGLMVHEVAISGLPLNPLVLTPDQRTRRVVAWDHIYKVSAIIQRVFGLGPQQGYRLREAIKEVYERAGIPLEPFMCDQTMVMPPFAALRGVLEGMEGTDELLGRISPLFDLQIFRGGATEHMERVISSPGVVRLSQLPSDQIKNAVGEILLLSLYNYLIRQSQPHQLTRILVLDEAWRLTNSPFLEPLMREGRAFGLGVIIATQFLTDLTEKIIGSAATWIYFGVNDPDSIRANVRALLGKATGGEAERLGGVFRELPQFQGIAQSQHFYPYVRLQVVPYYERT